MVACIVFSFHQEKRISKGKIFNLQTGMLTPATDESVSLIMTLFVCDCFPNMWVPGNLCLAGPIAQVFPDLQTPQLTLVSDDEPSYLHTPV